ncbi:MAG: aldo/keto reductase [Anaerolineae bacterium]|nr:aldo/keto reductase [Anaerolineae bacterium]
MEIDYRYLGRTGVRVSPLCLGTMNFGYRTDEATAREMIQQAIMEGINFIDTANFYGQPARGGRGQGITEEIVGKAIHDVRERIVLATKFFLPMDLEDPNARGGSRRHIIQQCEASLRRLQTDYIDIYQMHRPDPNVPVDETLRALDDLIRAGKVRYIGTSQFPAWEIVESIWIAKEHHLNRFVTEQPRYNILHRQIENELRPMAQQYGLGLLAYAPLQGGLLSGQYRRNKPIPKGSRLKDDVWQDWATSFLSDSVYDVLDVLEQLAAEKSATVSQVAVAWVIAQKGITSTIIGPRTPAHLRDNLDALKMTLTQEDCERIDSVAPPGKNIADR